MASLRVAVTAKNPAVGKGSDKLMGKNREVEAEPNGQNVVIA